MITVTNIMQLETAKLFETLLLFMQQKVSIMDHQEIKQ